VLTEELPELERHAWAALRTPSSGVSRRVTGTWPARAGQEAAATARRVRWDAGVAREPA
jgi:hypothetical protein